MSNFWGPLQFWRSDLTSLPEFWDASRSVSSVHSLGVFPPDPLLDAGGKTVPKMGAW